MHLPGCVPTILPWNLYLVSQYRSGNDKALSEFPESLAVKGAPAQPPPASQGSGHRVPTRPAGAPPPPTSPPAKSQRLHHHQLAWEGVVLGRAASCCWIPGFPCKQVSSPPHRKPPPGSKDKSDPDEGGWKRSEEEEPGDPAHEKQDPFPTATPGAEGGGHSEETARAAGRRGPRDAPSRSGWTPLADWAPPHPLIRTVSCSHRHGKQTDAF